RIVTVTLYLILILNIYNFDKISSVNLIVFKILIPLYDSNAYHFLYQTGSIEMVKFIIYQHYSSLKKLFQFQEQGKIDFFLKNFKEQIFLEISSNNQEQGTQLDIQEHHIGINNNFSLNLMKINKISNWVNSKLLNQLLYIENTLIIFLLISYQFYSKIKSHKLATLYNY
ncbi:hypothetical protein pb186bvf_021189, partial [Paramecium bursaria]